MLNLVLMVHKAVAAVAPIDGIVIGRCDDRSTWRIDFRPDASPAEQDAAKVVLASFDIDAAVAAEQTKPTLESRVAALEATKPSPVRQV